MAISANLTKACVPLAVLSAGSYQSYKDYKHANPADKRKVLLKDMVILAGTCAGTLAGYKIEKKYASRLVHNQIKSILPTKADILQNACLPMGGILGGFLSGEIAEKFIKVKSENKNKKTKAKLEKLVEFNYGTAGSVYDIAGVAGMAVGGQVDSIFAALAGFDIGKKHGFKSKLKATMTEIIAGVVFPTIAIIYIGRAITKAKPDIHPGMRALILTPFIALSYMVGNSASAWFNDKVTAKLLEKELWKKMNERQKRLMDVGLKSLTTSNIGQIISDLAKISQMKDETGIKAKNIEKPLK